MTWKARPSVLWHCWLGHLTRKIVSEVTYNVSSGTLNPTIPCGLCRKFARGYTLSAALSRNEEPLRRARVDVRHGTRLHGQGGDDAAILDAAHLVAIIADYIVDITNWWGDKATLHLSCRAAAEAAGDEGRTAHVGYLYLSGILSMKTTNDPTKPRQVCAAYICQAVHNSTTAGEGGEGRWLSDLRPFCANSYISFNCLSHRPVETVGKLLFLLTCILFLSYCYVDFCWSVSTLWWAQSNRLLYNNTVTGTLAVDVWTVTFGTARRGLGGLRPRPAPLPIPNVTVHTSTASVPTSYYSMWHCSCLCTIKG